MKKVLLITTLLTTIGSTATAQETSFGAKAGINISNFNYDFLGPFVPDTDPRVSMTVGFFADLGINDFFSIRPEILISNKGMDTQGEVIQDFFGDTFETSDEAVRLTYLVIPVYAVYKLEAGSGNVLLNAGPYLGFGIGGEIEEDGETSDIEFDSEVGTDEDVSYVRGLDFGFNIGTGYELASGLGFNFIYSLGISNLSPDPLSGFGNADDNKISNRVIRFSMSYRFN